MLSFSEIGEDDYLKFEAYGGMWDSGSPWFIKDIEWNAACDFHDSKSGPRTSFLADGIDAAIISMGGSRPLPPLANIFWSGSNGGSWNVANNWSPAAIPTSSDNVAIDNNSEAYLPSNNVYVKDFWIGINTGGSLYQTGGTLTAQDVYIGGRSDCNGGSYIFDRGSFNAHSLTIGCKGTGLLDINSPNPLITVSNLFLGSHSRFTAVPSSVIQIAACYDPNTYPIYGQFDIDKDANAVDLGGLGNLKLICGFANQGYDPNNVLTLEAAGHDNYPIGPNDFCMENFVLNKLVVGYDTNQVSSTAGRVTVRMVDKHHNQDGNEPEALYINTLELKAGATIEIDPNTGYTPFNLYYRNGSYCKSFLMGDINLDGTVDYVDLNIWTANQNAVGAKWSIGDINGDRVVKGIDKAIIEKAMKCAKNIRPRNNSTVSDKAPLLLQWNPGIESVYHKVYFGDSFAAVNGANEFSEEFFDNTGQNFFELTSLAAGHTYYWRIDEVDANDTVTKGYVWSFNYKPLRVRNVTKDKYYCWIQDAINDANNGDVIVASEDTYTEYIDFKGKSITVRSENPDDWATVSATIIERAEYLYYSVVDFVSGEGTAATLSGFTVRSDGVIFGIQCGRPYPIHSDCNPTISNCIITNNSAGVQCWRSAPIIKNNVIKENITYGIYGNYARAAVIENNLIYGTFSEDPEWGCAICLENSENAVTIRNNTIVNNAYGLYAINGAEPSIVNCIFWDNTIYDLWADIGLNPEYSCIEDSGFIGDPDITHNICENPLFVDAEGENFHLSSDSPCLNAGDPNGNYDGQKDIDSEPRVAEGCVDIGADEDYLSPADYDESGIVDFIDFTAFAEAWQTTSTAISLDEDSDVDYDDLFLFCSDWLWQPASGGWMESMQSMQAMPQLLNQEMAVTTEEVVDIGALVEWVEKIWEQDAELRTVIPEAEWQRFIDSLKAEQ